MTAKITNPEVDLARAAVLLEAAADACTDAERKASIDRVVRWMWRRVDALRAGADTETGEVPKKEDGT